MKSRTLLNNMLAVASLVVCFTACKKTTDASISDAATSTSLSQDMAISDNISDDVNGAFVNELEVGGGNVIGSRPTSTTTAPNYYCYYVAATSIRDTAVAGHFGTNHDGSKVITLAFDGTACGNGVTRFGIVTIVLTDSLRKYGSTATMTFNNYYVNGYKREGKIIWTNTRTTGNPTWTRVDSGKVTAPDNAYWYITGSRSVEETSSGVFSITSGSRTVTNANGKSATATVLTPLVAEVGCPFLESGHLQITGNGPLSAYTLVIDYDAHSSNGLLTGNIDESGGCDNIATYSINGGTAYPFYLVHN